MRRPIKLCTFRYVIPITPPTIIAAGGRWDFKLPCLTHSWPRALEQQQVDLSVSRSDVEARLAAMIHVIFALK